MKKRNLIFFTYVLFVLTACSTTIPVRNYMDQTIPQYGNSEVSSTLVERSIIKGAISLGWQTKIIKSGLIEATLNIRTHQLVVLISHDEKNYSIEYKDSINLKYNGKKIHRQYVNWVNNLINAINAENIRA
ncbi:hypothetical protein [Pseudoalteromonas denitrificans]|uniref:Lipoprotein n=1 Tax=Pseudoalteromonas denitrificans DSM 6059 TaxID=1123010 RepID=A0A1I1J2H9_9GAMM|nr:hypothetical protein [Pseudoalteromonas denitrificans]SFC42809.1 hypothetical protein SAMN02745724_01633 [Pseudoalteromonas denitrificans DSM 6059]